MILLGDIEDAAMKYLAGRSEVTALCPPAQIGARRTAALPCVAIARSAGGATPTSRPRVMARPGLQIDVYAETKTTARLLAETVNAALAEWPDRQNDDRVNVGLVLFLTELLWIPDETGGGEPTPRYISDLTVSYA